MGHTLDMHRQCHNPATTRDQSPSDLFQDLVIAESAKMWTESSTCEHTPQGRHLEAIRQESVQESDGGIPVAEP